MKTECKNCPECVVLFDDSGYHSSIPDSHSDTCKKCLMENVENEKNSLTGITIERMKNRWYMAWLVTLYAFIFESLRIIHPMSIEASEVGIALCRAGFGITVYVFLCSILDYIITKHKSKHE